jgi:hypothetical protein
VPFRALKEAYAFDPAISKKQNKKLQTTIPFLPLKFDFNIIYNWTGIQ